MWLDRCRNRLLAFLGPVYSSIRSPSFRQAAVRYLIITMRHVDSPFTAQCELRMAMSKVAIWITLSGVVRSYAESRDTQKEQ